MSNHNKTLKAWKEWQKWQNRNSENIREGQTINKFYEFRDIYEQSGYDLDKIKYEVQYQMSQKTYNALNKIYKKNTGSDLPKSVLKQNTHDVAKLIQQDINDYRMQLMQEGKSPSEIALMVSEYFFGS